MRIELAILATLSCVWIGCVSYDLSGVPAPEASSTTSTALLAVVVQPIGAKEDELGRDAWRAAAELASDLEALGFRVRLSPTRAEVPPGAFTIESYAGEPYGKELGLPLSGLTLLSVGIIPSFEALPRGHRCVLRRAPDGEPTEIDSRYRVRYVFGALAPPLNLLPGRASSAPEDQEGPPRGLRTALEKALENTGRP